MSVQTTTGIHGDNHRSLLTLWRGSMSVPSIIYKVEVLFSECRFDLVAHLYLVNVIKPLNYPWNGDQGQPHLVLSLPIPDSCPVHSSALSAPPTGGSLHLRCPSEYSPALHLSPTEDLAPLLLTQLTLTHPTTLNPGITSENAFQFLC